MQRRQFLKVMAASAGVPLVSGALAACSSSSTTASTTTSGAPTTGGATTTGVKKPLRKVKIGFIALTDSASIIMAKELGYFTERSLDVELVKQASWPALRDALLTGQIDAAHCLYTMPLAVATKVGGNGSTDLKIAMILSNNGQAITLAKEFASVGYGDLTKAKALVASANAPEFAMTFPGGTHDLWLRYWLAACGVDGSKLKIGPVPPPQMVQNMTVGNVKGFCVGEPWNATAVSKGIGFTTLATQDLWLNHPEKALVATSKFAAQTDEALADVMAAILTSSRWLDDVANRSKAADTLGVEKYVNAKPDDIRGRLTGVYDLGAGLGTKDFKGEQMQFFRDGETNMPRKSHLIWAMTQYQRFGMLKQAPDYAKLADTLVLSDLYAKVATAEGVALPTDEGKPFEIRLDKVTFDPVKPEAEAARGVAA